jgi:DNA-binding winged helix-turn-helix (wHTH) protein/Tol biopolymer transport system component
MTGEKDPSDSHPPIDLAREADFFLGTLEVTPSTREVIRGGERELLEPRVMQVLVALYRAGGRVVSRDELIARCWEGRIVGEDAINRAIGRLRRLSDVDPGNSFVIETIARVGYRLTARSSAIRPSEEAAPLPAQPSSAMETPAPLTAAASAKSRSNFLVRRRLAAAFLVLLFAGAVAAWLFWPQPRLMVASSRDFVATLALEDYPAFSPSGATLAYASGAEGAPHKIYVRNLAGGDGVRVTDDTTDDIWPTWSSDGAHLAYVASEPGEPCRIMVATVPAGQAREAGRCDGAQIGGIAWQPGTSYLYAAQSDGLKGESIVRLDLDSGVRQRIVHRTAMRDAMTDLHCSPDGKWLLYLLGGRAIIIRDLVSGQERQLGAIPDNMRSASVAWLTDSSMILASMSGGAGSQITAFPINGDKSYSVYATASRIGRLAAGNGVLALQTDDSRRNLARATASAVAAPDILDAANGITRSPTFAPDGTLAFLSDRSGTNAIWVLKPGSRTPTLLFDDGFSPLYRIQYSPDGKELAAVISAKNGITIRIISADGASLSSFNMPSLGLGLPTWTPDGKALIVFDRHSLQSLRIPVNDPARRRAIAPPHWVGITMHGDAMLATRADKPGVWRIDGTPRLLNGKYPVYYAPLLTLRGDDVLVPFFQAGQTPQILAQPMAGGAEKILAYAPGAANRPDFQSDFAVNPKSGDVIYTAAVAHDTNIELLTLAKR